MTIGQLLNLLYNLEERGPAINKKILCGLAQYKKVPDMSHT